LEILEPRILYSADALSLLQPDALAPSAEVRSLDHYAPAPATTQGAEHALPPPAPTTVDTPAQAQRHEIVFVDTAVSGYQQLVANLKSDLTRSVDVVLIDAARDGVEQISQALAGQHDVSAVHIISYGADGEVLLGTTRLDLDTLLTHAAQIKGWGDALTENADLLLYGCDVAEDAAGQALVQQLALLTGADVAASSDLTGNSTLGGDWVLEYRVGAIETAVAPDAATQQKWVGVLDAWYDPAWSYRQAITIDHTKVAADQTDFPVLISTTDPNWKSTGNGGYVGQTDGGDFVFTLADGVTKLDHQIETYDPTTGQLVAWVRMPTLSSSTDTSIKLYFGNAAAADQWNPTGVWDANFQGVWHLNQGTGVTAVDSTSHADGATPTNNPTASTGEIGGALTFTSTSWMTIGAAAALDLKTYSDWTLSAWVKPTSYAGTKWPIIYSYGTYDASLGLTVREGTDGLIENWTNDATLRQSTTAVTLNAWNYVTISRTAATTTFYLNGVAVGSGTSTAITRSGDPSYIGGGGFVDDQFLGLIDEVRVSGNSTSSGTRSASWIATEYANQNSPGSFYTLVNEAPTLDNTKSPALTAQNEDSGAPSGAVGTLVSSLVDFASPSGQVDNVTDPGAGALLGIAVTTADTANGAWYYSTDSGTNWVALGAVANNNARLLAADANTRLYFQPNANYNGTLATAITFRAWDQTSGTNGTLADTSTNGGTTAFSTATDTASLVVTSVNDAPVGTNNTVTTLEDTAYTFAAADFGFTDPGDSPANALNAVKITTLPGAGTLALSGVAVIAGDFVSVANINSGNLKFTPAANASGAGYAAFTFQVQDDGGTANSGVDLDATPRTMTVDVTAVADTPSVTNATTNEDTQTTSGLVISRNAADGAEVTNFKITGISNGTLYKNDGTTQIANGTFITFAEGNAGLKFTPTANFNGSGSFTAQASTSNADGGLGGSTVNATITVTSVNDAPVGTNKTVTTLEDTAYTFAAADFGFTDPGDSPANALNAVKITTLPGAGTLALSGVAVIAGDFVSVANINSGNLKFTPAANASGAGYAAFTFQVQDDGGTANSGVDLDATPRTLTVDVTAVADTPSVTNATTNEDTQTTSGLVISRNAADGAEVTNFKITGISNGTLYKNDGTTQIANGTFITFAEGNAGLKFTPTANFNGSGSFTAQASTSNADGGLGGSTVNATITVTSVNDAPVGTNKTVTTLEDTAYTFAATDFGFTDPSDSPANALAAVKITTTPGAGTLTLSGLAVNASDFVSVANINAGNLKFTPAANASGAGYAAFTFQVQDDGGTANSGIDLDATPRTMTVNVTAVTVDVIVVNHAPAITSDGAGAAAAVSIPENTTTVTTVTATDSDLPAQTLTYAIAGGADAAKFTINASTGALSFLAAPNFEIPTDADLNNIYQVTVQVSDGMLTDSQAIAVTVTNVNEAPTATNMSAGETYTEDTPHNLAAIAVNDVDSATVTVTLALSDAAAGRLNTGSSGAVTSTYDAGAGVWSASGTIADVNTLLAGLTFTPAPNYNANFSIATSVSDGMAAPLTGGKVMSGVRVNDPPVGVPTITGTPTKDQTLSASTAGISDADRLGAFNYQWLSNGAGIAGATSDTYTLGDADVGTNISVRVAYTDGGGTNETVTSDPTAAVSGTQNNSVLPKNNPVLPINTAAPAGNGTGTGTGNGAGTTSAANNTGTSTSSGTGTTPAANNTGTSTSNGTGTTPAANNTGTSTTNPVIRTPDIANSATANNATAASSAARSTPTPAPATESREAPGFSSVNDGSSGAPVLFVQRTVVSGGGGSGTGPTAGSTSSEARVAYRVYLRAGSEPIALSALAPAMVTAQAISPAGPQELPLSSAASGRVLAGSTTGMVSMPGSDAPAAELLNEVTSVAGVARVTGVVVLAGAASWAAQGTTLVAALLAGAPAWQHIDPLPVLGSGEEPTRKKPDEEDEAPAEEDAVANLWRVDAGADTTT
jgi:hypothetical protein